MTKPRHNPPFTKTECGRLGGLATSKKYGHAYMIRLASKGGERYNQKYVAGGLSGIDTGQHKHKHDGGNNYERSHNNHNHNRE